MKLDFSVHRIDVKEMVKKGLPPAFVIPADGPKWFVLNKPFNPTDNLDTAYVANLCQGDYVSCNLFPYITPADPLTAIGFVGQMAFAIGNMFPNATKLAIGIGYPLDLVDPTPPSPNPGYRIWLGFAVCQRSSR